MQKTLYLWRQKEHLMAAKIYLLPTTLGDSDLDWVIPTRVRQLVNETDHYIVENNKTARRYLIKAGIEKKIDDLHFYTLNKRTQPHEVERFLQAAIQGNNMAVISEAGTPGVADPGADVVALAHQKGLQVVPLVGPSSILLALMASGLNGQNFAFNGYLPIKKGERIKKLRQLEARSKSEQQSQLFIEAPYRNNAMLADILECCKGQTLVTVAADITLESEFIRTLPVAQWKKNKPELHKRPAIFILHQP